MDYAIGDIQGCYQSLLKLLDKINFDDAKDTLWLVGDLVNRGPQSLEVLQLLKTLKTPAKIVLGNHDLHLLAVFFGEKKYRKKKDTFKDVLKSSQADEICHWLLSQKIALHCPEKNVVMAHAGIWPHWNIDDVIKRSEEVEREMQKDPKHFFANMYGNSPDYFSEDLSLEERLRFSVNAFTRMRYCFPDGRLELKHKGANPVGDLVRWFKTPKRKELSAKILFGHWASLNGKVSVPNIYGLDTGCIWGGDLTALCLQTVTRYSISSIDSM